MGFGCAEYSGQDTSDAKIYLDSSQGQKGFAHHSPAHPRNHCSNPTPNCMGPCVEKYSLGSRKTGFLSQQDQDLAAHLVLKHPRIQKALHTLNQYNKETNYDQKYTRRCIDISVNDLNFSRTIVGGVWVDGVNTSKFYIDTLTIVLQHFNGQETNPRAPVHILTFYPRCVDKLVNVINNYH